MLRNNIIEIFGQTWPTLLICMVIIISLRVVYLIKNEEKIILHRELITIAFITYVLCLFYVVTFQDVSWSSSNFIPFKEILRYDFGSRLFLKNILGNIIMFLPYGFFVGYYLKLDKTNIALFLTLLVSTTIETTQLIIGRVFDIDDILLNVIGGLLGCSIFTILHKIENRLPDFLKKDWFYNIIVILVSLVFILYLFNFIKLGV